MSTLQVTNIKATGETASRAVSGVAATWCNLEGNIATLTIRDSFNVASVTDTATGRHGLNFTNSFGSSNFCMSGSTRGNAAGTTNLTVMQDDGIARSASKVSYIVKRGNNTASSDNSDEHVSAHGDLA
jgi:hypothetical protein